MLLNKIDFPNRIIDAIKDEKLIIFAGAGASMGKPTCLPNFTDLAIKIAEGTGKIIKKNKPCEVFLGALKARGIDVNEMAAVILSDSCRKHNALHEAIVDLFISPEKVKIVTTNYDQMFEQVLEERSISATVYNAPALPLGNDVKGIIHLHGNVCEPKYMVVTDEDFGKAYLTEGYASRFLIKLFESYTILFVGYSYNDTILRYLTRAMSRQYAENRYILTDDTKSDWKSLGIYPISYPRRAHTTMRKGLIKLGSYSKKGLWDWHNHFSEIAETPPKDLTIETEIDYCLENIEISRVLAYCVYGKEWLDLLDQKGVFSYCFSETTIEDKNGELWANWLCDKFLGNDDRSLMLLFAEHGNSFNRLFGELLIRKISQADSDLSDNYYRKYITLLDKYFVNPRMILRHIELSHNRHLYHLCFHLFEKLFVISIKLKKNNWRRKDDLEPKHLMTGDYYRVEYAWKIIKTNVILQYPIEILLFLSKTVEELHYMYEEMEQASGNKEPWSMAMLVIEDREKEYNKEPLHILIQAFIGAIKELKENEFAESFLINCLNSKSILLRKIALRAIRESAYLSADAIIKLLCDKELIWFFEGKEQVFLLAQHAFKNASTDIKDQFLNIIEKGPDDYEERTKNYSIYNWCIWLQRIDPENKRVGSIIERILSEYKFSPREHPELDIIDGTIQSIPNESPVSKKEMLEMPGEELIELLLTFKGDSFNGQNRWALLGVFSDCIKESVCWTRSLISLLYANRVDNAEIWTRVFNGLAEADLTINELLSMCKEFIKIVEIQSDVQSLADYLWKLLRNDDIEKVFNENEKMLFELSQKIWKRRTIENPGEMRVIDKALNSTTGTILLCWIYMISYSNNETIPSQYKKQFEIALQLDSWEREVGICILAGHFNFFCHRDKDWCVEHFEPMLTGNNKEIYKCAWEGLVHFSNRIYKDTTDIIAPVYLKAVKNISWLEDEVLNRFIELYLILLIYFVEKPTQKYIPDFYKASSEKKQRRFVETIENQLNNMTEETKITWWNNWLKQFLDNRKKNKPVVLLEPECQSLFMLLPRLSFVFDEAVSILCKGKMPTSLDLMFWYELNAGNFAVEHSESTAKLLIKILSSINVEYVNNDIIAIVKKLHGLGANTTQQLREVLLKHNMSII